MTLFRLLFFAALLTGTGLVWGQTPWPEAGAHLRGQLDAQGWPVVPDLTKVGRGETVPTVLVREVVASEGETFEQTLVRASSVAATFTRQSGFEACALVCTNNLEQGGFRLTTNFSQVGCLTRHEPASCPAGFSMTNETLHTHPEIFQARANPVDAIFTGQRRGRLLKIEPNDFSPGDRRNGPGYLVAMGRVLHQTGKGHEHDRVVDRIHTAHTRPRD